MARHALFIGKKGALMVLDSLSAADRVNLLELYARSVMLLELGRCGEWADLFEPHARV